VAAGDIGYFLAGGGPGGTGPGDAAAGPGGGRGPAGRGGVGTEISTWVAENFAAVSIGGQTVYDLSRPIG
jgi:hypothetical protein